jgi:hypothetical protein
MMRPLNGAGSTALAIATSAMALTLDVLHGHPKRVAAIVYGMPLPYDDSDRPTAAPVPTMVLM